MIAGYLAFFFAEHSIGLIAVSAILMFVGQAFIQLLMLMFLADTIEYGQWKLGRRSESITFSIQPLVNKIGRRALDRPHQRQHHAGRHQDKGL